MVDFGCRLQCWMWIGVVLAQCPQVTAENADAPAAGRPNVVVIMTDNHGAWTLGCYGNPDIRTPYIDRLAAEGVRFDRAFACNPVCSPTRATFLTGLLPSQHGVHCFLVGGRLQVGPQARNTLASFTSLPEILRRQGYACGLVGKWHLGDNLRPQEGLEEYWITMPHGGTSTFYDAEIIESGRLRREPEYLTDFWTRHAVRFIEREAADERPFFLFLSYNGPYALSRLLLREGRNRHAEFYADKELASFPLEKTHPWQYSNRDYHNNPVSLRRVATEVSGVDDGVGEVMRTLDRLGIDDQTLVIFLADQGWVGGHGGFFGMGDHTRPVTARDGMMRIPLIWRHPGQIRAGAAVDQMVSNYDLLPTLLGYLGLGEQTPETPRLPGRDFSDLLAHEASPGSFERPVYYEFESLRCIRTERWKYVHRHPNGPHELYDLRNDPGEFDNLVDQPDFAARRDQLKQQLETFFAEYASPEYDLWRGGGSQTRLFVGIEEELAQVEPVDPPPLTRDFTPAEIEVPDGFTVELAAGPPLVNHPTLACFDDRGRLFVCDNAGVNMTAQELEEELPNSIRLLEDTDADGRFDRSTVFADRMTFPMGGAWHDGALYVASPPNIWRLRDTDGDRVADQRDVLVGQFGYTGNAASIHGCFNGPDGRLYWCDGYHGHEFRDAQGKVATRREGSYLFSCWPDGTDVRIHAGGGMDNPVEVDFTDEGEMLGTVNILYTRPRVDALVHWLHGGVYPHRESVLDEVKITGDWLDALHRFGHVAVSGLARYRSGAIDHQWRDNLFVAFFNQGKVVRVEVQPDKASFRATQREFVSSPDRDFHPTDVLEDADGSLLVIDTGGWFYRGCPTSQLSKPDILGGIYRIRRRAMTRQVDPWGLGVDWPRLSATQLTLMLQDTRYKVRERAIEECARRGSAIVPALAQAVARRDLPVRQNAVWALTRLARIEAESAAAARAAIRSALADGDLRVRLAACRSISTNPDPLARESLIHILLGDEPPLRREAATALGRIGDASAVPSLLDALRRNADRSEEHAIIYALIELAAGDETRKGLNDDSAAVRRGALLALDQMDGTQLDPDSVAPLVSAEDARLRETAVDVVLRNFRRATGGEAERWVQLARMQLTTWLTGDETLPRETSIRELVGALAEVESIASLIGSRLSDPNGAPEIREMLLAALAEAQPERLHDSWIEPLGEELQAAEPASSQRALRIVSRMKSERLQRQLQTIAADPGRPPLLRVAALEALAGPDESLTQEAFRLLIDLLSDPAGQSAAASQIIGGSVLNTEQLEQLVPQLSHVGPEALRDLIRPFARTRDLDLGKAFLDELQQASALRSLPPSEFSDVIKRFPPQLLPDANRLLEQIRADHERQLAGMDRLLPHLEDGDPQRGRAVFFSEKAKCSSCHRVAGEGSLIGPDLTTIGANRSVRDLLEAIVFPSASIVRQYESYAIITTGGRSFTGLITRETEDAIYLQQQTGEPIELRRKEIEGITPLPTSVMPNGLDQALDVQQLADVIAWLQTLDNVTTARQ